VEYAQSALGQGELSLAESLAAGVLKTYPANPNADAKAHLILGRTFLKLDKDADARHELEAAVRLNPNYENGYTLAVACLDLEDAACAARIFSEMQASFGDTASLHLQFGLAYGESDFQKQAIEEFQTAIKEDDQLPEAHYALAAAYLNEGSASGLEAADAELKKELQISPDDAMTYAALGRAAMNQHQDEKAETYLKRAISLNPTSPDAYLYLGEIFMEANRGDDAVAALRNAIRYTADVTRNRFQVQRAHYLLGRLLLKSGDEAGGRAELKQAQDLSKAALAQDKRRLGGILSDRGQDRKEESLPLHSAQNSPEIASAVNMKKDEQVSELQTKLASPLADSFNNLGVIAARRNDFATAVDYFRNAAQWNPSLDGLDYNWGRAEFAAEKFAEAIAPLSRYLASHPDNMESRSQLALSLYKVRRYTAVLDTLAPVQSTFQTNPQLAELYAQSRAKIATQ
jgi:tetratricopeptide (TPR) repeat protein